MKRVITAEAELYGVDNLPSFLEAASYDGFVQGVKVSR
jgi:hypothetical protein